MLREQMDEFISQGLAFAPKTSELIFTVGKPPQAESQGELKDIFLQPDLGPLRPFQLEEMASCLLRGNLRLYAELTREGSCDLSYALRDQGRFRVNIFQQRGNLAIVMRRLPQQVPSISGLGLPKVLQELAREKFGLVLVAGATGTGKTTTLAALVNELNSTRPGHILTLEDPIEYEHQHKSAVISQRELGVDFPDFAAGLRAALRQSPEVILVGELRDRETLEIALEAAETGHLVLGTIHAEDAGQGINRVIGMFEHSQERQVRSRLAEALKAVVAQRIMPQKNRQDRIVAFEVLRRSLRIRELILNGEDEERTFTQVVSSSQAAGMFTFEHSLSRLYQGGLISEEVALLNASDKPGLKRRIEEIKAARGELDTDIKGLEVDWNYEDKVLPGRDKRG